MQVQFEMKTINLHSSQLRLTSTSNPRDWRELKKTECEDLRARSTSKTRTRRLEGFSGEKEVVRIGRRGMRVRNMRSFYIFDFGGSLVFLVLGLCRIRDKTQRLCVWERERERERVSVSENGSGRVDLENCSFFRGQWVILVMTKKKFLFVSPTYTPLSKWYDTICIYLYFVFCFC